MPSVNENARLVKQQKYGFWVRTKNAPHRAVRWEAPPRDDGSPSFRGRNWVEIREHGATHEPMRFYAKDVEVRGPHEWLTYYPEAGSPICGWGRPRLPRGDMQYCPRVREADEPFCRAHMAELQGEEVDGQAEEAQRPDTE